MKTAVSPLHRILALLARMRAAFPECGLSLSLLWDWALEQKTQHQTWAADIAAIDDDLQCEFPLFEELLRNDPPAKRAKALRILREITTRTAARAAEVAREA